MLDDFEDTIKKLKYVASSLNVCDNPRLQSLGYRRINFQQDVYKRKVEDCGSDLPTDQRSHS